MNTIEILYDNDINLVSKQIKKIKEYLNLILKSVNLDNCEFSVAFVGEEHMHQLNKEYRDIDDSTDILSFAVEDDDCFGFVVPKNRKRNIGDMLICTDVMERNAEAFKVSYDEELRRLLIHGVLHLAGENHETNDSSEPMLVKQEKILKNLGSYQILD